MSVVLIETYWNVKTAIINPAAPLVISLNRNILECKDDLGGLKWEEYHVLIETYWNVKLMRPARRASNASLNRNILECKDNSDSNHSYHNPPS